MSTPLSLSSRVRWSDDQLAASVDQEIVILSVERGSYYGLDDIGSEIWRQMADPIPVASLCDALEVKYEVERTTLERDIIALLEKLVAEGLVSVVA